MSFAEVYTVILLLDAILNVQFYKLHNVVQC